jgi:hypothetical protein
LSTVNLSLGKSFAVWEQVHLEVRGDANNVFNHANFGLPANGLSLTGSAISTGTSQISSTSVPMRTMQLSARITF